MDVPSYFEAVREHYLNQLEASIAELRAKAPGSHFDVEASILRPEAPEIPHRFDISFVVEGERCVLDVHAEDCVPWEPVVWTRNGLTLTVAPIAWDRCVVVIEPKPPQETRRRMIDWYAKWFDDTNTVGEPPFRGVVHEFTPEAADGADVIRLDLGSAQATALLELVDLLAACGVRSAGLYTHD